MRFLLFFFLTVLGGIAKATNYYVDPSSTASTATGAQATPWKTLSQVQSKMSSFVAGDIIYFKKGQVFSGSLDIRCSGTATAPITFTSYGTDANMPIFTGSGAVMVLVSYQKYVVIDGFKITDTNMDPNDHSAESNLDLGFYIDGSDHITVRNCDISLVGAGVNIQGDYNTIEKTTIGNLRMIRNTPGGEDDYGANPVIISGSYNNILNNFFKDGWAYSYDFTYDGGAIEIYGAANHYNKIMYNTAINCDGFMEIGYSNGGASNNNLVAYNKIINCGELVYISNSGSFATSVNNLQIFNNVLVVTVNQLTMPTSMIGMSSNSSTSNIISLKNNIFWLSSGIDVAFQGRFTGSQMTHEDNIYHLGTGSVLNFTANSSELTTTANLFANVSASDPLLWDYTPVASSPAIDFGQNLGLTKDFAGNTVPSIPNAGILENIVAGGALSVAATNAGIKCNGGTTTVTVSASGGTAPYTGTGTFTVSAGTYTYSVTDAAGTVRNTSITVTQPASLSVSATAGSILSIGGTTSINLAATGGTSPYTFSINGSSFISTLIFTLIPAGTHLITVKDVNGCTANTTVSVTEPGSAPTQLTASSSAGTINCNGGTTTVTVSATGGTAPYTGTGNFTVGAGTYNYTIIDAAGSVKTTSVTVSQPTALASTATAGTINVYGGTTTISTTASGGTSPYSYSLNGGNYQSAGSFSSVAAGTQTITVKDSRGCTIVKTVSITQPTQLVLSSTQGTITCNGSTTTVTISATGGKTPYTGTGTFTASAGMNNYTVTDAGGAVKTISVTISQPAAITASINAPGVQTASATTTATITASGGTAGYTYSLDGGTYRSSNSFSNVSAGNHSVRIKDSKGCLLTKTFTVELIPVTPLRITAVKGWISCYGGTTTVTVTASGGFAPYTGTGVFTVPAGSRTYTVTDASGATASQTVAIVEPRLLVLTVTAGTITTNGGSTTVTMSATGGTRPYSYKIGSGNYQTSESFSNITAGTYTATVKDGKGCTTVQTFTITQPAAALQLNLISKTNITCKGRTDGTIKVSGLNGTSPYVYKKTGSSYSSNNNFTNLAPGTYTITVKDATNATASISVTINNSQASCNRIAGREIAVTGEVKTNDVEGLKVNVFPNPATTEFSLIADSDSDEKIHIIVMNMDGQKVYENNGVIKSRTSFGNNFRAGVYFAKVIQGDRVKIVKLIKSK